MYVCMYGMAKRYLELVSVSKGFDDNNDIIIIIILKTGTVWAKIPLSLSSLKLLTSFRVVIKMWKEKRKQ